MGGLSQPEWSPCILKLSQQGFFDIRISEKSRPHLQSTVERPGNGDALGLGLARRDGSLQLVQVTVLLQLLYQALERQTSQ